MLKVPLLPETNKKKKKKTGNNDGTMWNTTRHISAEKCSFSEQETRIWSASISKIESFSDNRAIYDVTSQRSYEKEEV